MGSVIRQPPDRDGKRRANREASEFQIRVSAIKKFKKKLAIRSRIQ
jgi:hypothetical protein